MKTTTFTCTKSAEELSKSAREKKITFSIFMWACVIMVPILFYMMFWTSGTFVYSLLGLIIYLYAISLLALCFLIYLKALERMPKKYDIMPTKEFSWNETLKQFTYKDKDQTLRFKGDDIVKWVSYVNNKTQEAMDIIDLQTGEKIILEGEWNEEVHAFLNDNRISLGLPQPKRWSLSLIIY